MVPTRELGVQIVMLIYKLFGGSVNSQVPGDAANMFTYTGPRGLKVFAAKLCTRSIFVLKGFRPGRDCEF